MLIFQILFESLFIIQRNVICITLYGCILGLKNLYYNIKGFLFTSSWNETKNKLTEATLRISNDQKLLFLKL